MLMIPTLVPGAGDAAACPTTREGSASDNMVAAKSVRVKILLMGFA
jgi:hypothetical protein